MTTPPQTTVVGDGIAGLTAAVLFAEQGCQVDLIAPAFDLTRPRGPIALRNYAVTPASRAVLEHAGVWSELDHERTSPIENMMV